MPVLDADEAAALPRAGGLLLDARAGERYRGEVEPIDPRAGHIPGAVSAPDHGEPRAPTARSCPAAVCASASPPSASAGATVGVYCGSGVTAAHEVAALAAAGIDAALWPGSWSQWSLLRPPRRDGSRPG